MTATRGASGGSSRESDRGISTAAIGSTGTSIGFVPEAAASEESFFISRKAAMLTACASSRSVSRDGLSLRPIWITRGFGEGRSWASMASSASTTPKTRWTSTLK